MLKPTLRTPESRCRVPNGLGANKTSIVYIVIVRVTNVLSTPATHYPYYYKVSGYRWLKRYVPIMLWLAYPKYLPWTQLAASCGSSSIPGRPAHNNDPHSCCHSGRARQENREKLSEVDSLKEPTLVNTASPSTRLQESKNQFKTEKKSMKIWGRALAGSPRPLRPQSVTVTSPEQQRLLNVRWRRLYIDRRTPPVVTYPAVSSKKLETEIR